MSLLEKKVQITADALVILRADKELMDSYELKDPFAHHFVTEQGKKMMQLACETDSSYIPFNLLRYKWFGDKTEVLLEKFSQILILGAGYDCRLLDLALKTKNSSFFEVDLAGTLESKWKILLENGISKPKNIYSISSNLENPKLLELLLSSGFISEKPSLVLLEGVFFFLKPAVSKLILDPKTFRLASESVLLFDFWEKRRVMWLNSKLQERLGTRLFHAAFDDASEMQSYLNKSGYKENIVTPVDELSLKTKADFVAEFKNSWFVVEAHLK
ncbi:MAG: class I SAM-dependent methyltransferase [Bacteriovoracia bacterium]